MESYFFFSHLFFFFFLPHLFFFPSLSLIKSWDGFSPWKSPLFTYHSFFFFPSPLFYTSFFPSFTLLFSPPFLSYSNFFLPLSPCLPFYFFPIFLLSILVCFFFFPSTLSTFITIPRSQINVINIFTINVRPHKLTLLFHIPTRT